MKKREKMTTTPDVPARRLIKERVRPRSIRFTESLDNQIADLAKSLSLDYTAAVMLIVHFGLPETRERMRQKSLLGANPNELSPESPAVG